MATAKPVVAARIGGLADLVADGETGFLVPTAIPPPLRGAMARLLADPGYGSNWDTPDNAWSVTWPAPWCPASKSTGTLSSLGHGSGGPLPAGSWADPMSSPVSAQSPPGAPRSEPIRLLEVELSRPLPPAHLVEEETGRRYARAQVLVRLHGCPLGFVELDFPAGAGDAISPAGYAHLIWAALGPQILDHLQEDGLPVVSGSAQRGYRWTGRPCARARQAFLRSLRQRGGRHPPQSIAALRSLGALEYPASR